MHDDNALGCTEGDTGPARAKGSSIPLPSILALSVAAMLSGADSVLAIFRWGRRLRPEALRLHGFDGSAAPCHATYHDVFLSLDADALGRVLGRFALGDNAPVHIAIDGKTLKGSRRHDAKPLHVLSALATQPSCVVGDLVVEPDENDHGSPGFAEKPAPQWCDHHWRCHLQICRRIRDAEGHYLFAVKMNQPELHHAIAESFGDLFPLRQAMPGG